MATKSLGTTFTFTPAGGSAAKIGQLSAISELNCDSELIDVTTLSEQSGCRRFIQGARDAGEILLVRRLHCCPVVHRRARGERARQALAHRALAALAAANQQNSHVFSTVNASIARMGAR